MPPKINQCLSILLFYIDKSYDYNVMNLQILCPGPLAGLYCTLCLVPQVSLKSLRQSESKLIKKDHHAMCLPSLGRTRIMLWIGLKASTALITCTKHSEDKGGRWGDRRGDRRLTGTRHALLLPSPPRSGPGREELLQVDPLSSSAKISLPPFPYLPLKRISSFKGDFGA